MKTKVLYVEDEPFLGKIVKESLESRRYEVRMVQDGGQALAAFQSYQPDICVLDVMLPNKDGFEVGRDIRAMDDQIPILYVTAKDQTDDVLMGFRSGGNDYIRKPFSMEELIVRMHNLLQLAGKSAFTSSQKDRIIIGRFRFLPQRLELALDDDVRRLSHREGQILQLLLDHRDRIVERKAILMKVWGDDSYFNSRNLDVYIKRLRDYLKADPEVQIRTLKGVGYRFLAP